MSNDNLSNEEASWKDVRGTCFGITN